MNALLIIAITVVLSAIVFMLARVLRSGVATVKGCVKSILKILLFVSVSVCFVLGCILTCYAQLSEVLKSVLSANAVESIRAFFKSLSGAESTFVAIETLALTSVMISFFSCIAFAFDSLIMLLPAFEFGAGTVDTIEEEEEVICSKPFTSKTFLLYSKFNS